jgi:hypothetical protein
MVYPDLYKDESKVLEAQNVKVKSVTFEAVLTTRRLILTDTKKHMVPPQEILLATLKNVDSGENAIRDPTITLSIITNTGTTRQMILTFSSKTSGGERKREAEEWVKTLRRHVSQTISHPVLPDIVSLDEEMPSPAAEPAPPAAQPPRIEIVNAPPQKKRIEISRPMKKIVESEPAMPVPVETTSLPVGSFCNRCGSRVPPESAFCNRCGTPVVKDGDFEAELAPPLSPSKATVLQATEPVVVPAYPDPVVPEPVPVTPLQPAEPFPSPVVSPKESGDTPLEEVIHSIEPLIADSVPRKHERPVFSKPKPAPIMETMEAEPSAPDTSDGIQWPVITPKESAIPEPAAVPDAEPPRVPVAPPVPEPSFGRTRFIALGVLALIIIAVVAGIFLFANALQMMSGTTPDPTPVPTVVTPATTVPVTTSIPATPEPAPEITVIPPTAPALAIPVTGVWVRINYANQFSGMVGTPNGLRDISDTGEKFYQISTSTGTVVANIQKVDGSADPMSVEVYKDGELVVRKITTAPKGLVEIQENLKPPATPTIQPTAIVTTVVPDVTEGADENVPVNETQTG